MWNKSKRVAPILQIEIKLFRNRSATARKRFHDDSDTADENTEEINGADKSSEGAHFKSLYFM